MNRLFDGVGREIQLGGRIGRGGEGTVFEVISEPSVVAKIYHETVDAERSSKLATMVHQANPVILEIAAWPTTTLHGRGGGRILGILMPKIVGHHPIHELYSPAQRKATFPTADWSFLVHTARNLAQAFSTVHSQGHVVGDVNQGNVVVSSKALAKFIDCDSFQISRNGKTYSCNVGVGHFTPPELQGRSFGGLVRTPNHDNFGLAVLCFHLLFMGRHPFVGKFLGSTDMPIERAIREFRFAFGQGAGARQMAPPPHVLRLAGVSHGVASLFERAFSESAARSGSRPFAAEWVSALDLLRQEIRTCSRYAGHKYCRTLSECPWCAIEQGGGPDFFISITSAIKIASGFDLQAIWNAISQVPNPDASHEAPVLTSNVRAIRKPLPSRLRWVKISRVATGWGSLGALAGVLFGILPPASLLLVLSLFIVWMVLCGNKAFDQERARRKQAVEVSDQALQRIRIRWEQEVGEAQKKFDGTRRTLEEKRNEHQSLGSAYQRDRAALIAKREENQRRRFLEQYLIARASIHRVGPGLKTTLTSYGIETAADVKYQAVMAVPGFGPTRTSELLAWRAKLEKGFRFDPSKGVDPADTAALDQRYAAKRQDLERFLRTGVEELRRLSVAVNQRRSALLPELRRLSEELAQARADAAVA